LRYIHNFWNGYKWTVKKTLASHLLIAAFLIRAIFREDYEQILIFVISYVPLMFITYKSLEYRNRLRYIKKTDPFLYFEGLEKSNNEIYGGQQQ